MARPRFDKLDPEKQDEILRAAAEEFSARGYAAASMNRIAERAGSSKGVLYYYFEDKADLLATVTRRALARALEESRLPPMEALTAEDYWEQVREASRRSLTWMEAETWDMRLLRAFWHLRAEDAARAATAGALDWTRDVTRAYLLRGQELGVVRTDLPLELLLETFLAADQAGDRWTMEHWDDFDEPGKQRLLDARVDLARDMLDARHMGWEP
jgi:AcrR family transcriptional regulator